MSAVITTPNGNGKHWWQEVWGKVTAGLLLLVLTAVLVFVWQKAVEAAKATVEVYALPPIVQGHEVRLKELESRPGMTPAQVKTLAQQIAEELAKKKGKQ
jgi:hypothetical protein